MSTTHSIRLKMLGLPLMQTLEDFSALTHISKYTLYQLSYHANKYYFVYDIPKKSGKPRTICQPSKKLKGLQSWILINILDKLKVSTSCKGFEKGTSIANNAESHKGANTILTIDLSNFFPTINSLKVYNVFRAVGYNKLISTILTKICVYDNCLPQGSPCSPKLANLVAWSLDVRIQGYVGKRGITYTRYADDLSFSGLNPAKVVNVIPMIKTIIEDEDFHINPKKTRVAGSSRAKIVTGLILTNDSFGVGREKYKELRKKIYYLTLAHQQENIVLLNEVKGWLSYLNSVDKKRLDRAMKYIGELAKKNPNTLVAKIIK